VAQGNDFLMGKAGDDVYLFNRGDGQDSINNTDFLSDANNHELLAASDTLRFGEGITESDVVTFQVKTNLVSMRSLGKSHTRFKASTKCKSRRARNGARAISTTGTSITFDRLCG